MRKRSKYRPRPTLQDPVAWVINGFKPMATHPEAVTLRIRNHNAMHEIVQGNGTSVDVDTIISAVNICEALAMDGLGEDWMPEIRAGQDAVLTMARRGVERGKFLFNGLELTAVNQCIEIHDAQLDQCTFAQLEKATRFVVETIKHKRARAI